MKKLFQLKKLKIVIVTILTIVLAFAFVSFASACDSSTDCKYCDEYNLPQTHTVVFLDRNIVLFSEIFEIGEDISLTATQNPVRTGYEFSGWNVLSVGNVDGVLTTTVEAVWIALPDPPPPPFPIEKRVIFQHHDGTVIATHIITLGEPIGLPPAQMPSRSGHTFGGWEIINTANVSNVLTKTVRAMFIPIPQTPIEPNEDYQIVRFFNGSTLFQSKEIPFGDEVSFDGITIPSTTDFQFLGWRIDSVSMDAQGTLITAVSAIWNRLTTGEWGFPIVSIQTNSSNAGFSHDSRDVGGITRRIWVEDARISISNAEEPTFNFDYIPVDVRGRGNSTWGMFYRHMSYNKVPYRIRFPNNVDSFMPMLNSGYRARNWTLIASATDRTLLRHYTAFQLGRTMSGGANFCHVPFNRFVHLYINGDYRGVYKLTDHMDTDGLFYGETPATASGRVNIRGGNMPNAWRDNPYYREFYIEMCVRAGGYQQTPVDHHFWINNWTNSGSGGRRSFELRDDSGLGRASGPALEEEARAFTQHVHDTIRGRNWTAIQQVIDVPSFVDYFIVQDIMMNPDINFSSVHGTIRGTRSNRKMHMGPLWDFDLCADNSQWVGTAHRPDQGHFTAQNHPWFYNLVRHVPQFRALVAERLVEVNATYFPQTIAHINQLTTTYRTDFNRNFERWPIFGERVPAGSPRHDHLPSFDAHLNQFTTFITQRLAWMMANIR
ncbi:MAG: CotH kinase family protein [Firmicutes bacterium]|nr:CotH kinase family protein [Bacillota bacterium]